MSTAPKPRRHDNLGDLLKELGVSARRIRLHPPPGKATEQDVIRIHDRTDRLFELVEGVLVEKIMGLPESALGCELIKFLGVFLNDHDLGFVAGADGMLRLMPGLVRMPDVSFVSWERVPQRCYPSEPIPDLAADLAVEVLSEGNTRKEMARKRREYFLAGTRLVWMVDPKKRTVQVFIAPDQSVTLTEEQSLDGGDVLPGFSLPLRQLFARTPLKAGRPQMGKRKARKREPGE